MIVNALKLFCKLKNYLGACACRRIDIAKRRKSSKRRMVIYGDCRFCRQKRFHALSESVKIAAIDAYCKLVNAFFGKRYAFACVHALIFVRHRRVAITNHRFTFVFQQNVKRKHTAECVTVRICVTIYGNIACVRNLFCDFAYRIVVHRF